MKARISPELFRDYLECHYKAYLKTTAKSGIKSSFQKYIKPLNYQSALGGAAEDELSLTAKRMSSELTTAPNLLLSFFKSANM